MTNNKITLDGKVGHDEMDYNPNGELALLGWCCSQCCGIWPFVRSLPSPLVSSTAASSPLFPSPTDPLIEFQGTLWVSAISLSTQAWVTHMPIRGCVQSFIGREVEESPSLPLLLLGSMAVTSPSSLWFIWFEFFTLGSISAPMLFELSNISSIAVSRSLPSNMAIKVTYTQPFEALQVSVQICVLASLVLEASG
eukprot:Gb_28800 [translate_table: standard]